MTGSAAVRTVLSLFLVVSGILPACGYRFSAGGTLPGNTIRVAVSMFENKSSHSGAEVELTNALIREIMLSSDARVVDRSDSNAVISGTIESLTFSNLSRTSSDQVLERQVIAAIRLKMVRDGETVWELKNYRGVEEAAVSSENISDEAGKDEVIRKVFAKMAQKIVSRMQDDF